MSKKRSDFFAEMSGCLPAMRNSWLRQAVRADFRGGRTASYDGDYDQPIVLVFYGGGYTYLRSPRVSACPLVRRKFVIDHRHRCCLI